MRTTRIDLEGQPGNYATLRRPRGSRSIRVTLLTPSLPDGEDHQVDASDEQALQRMAQHLQERLEGHRGTNSDVYGYLQELLRLAD